MEPADRARPGAGRRRLLMLNKPYGVLCQFSAEAGRPCLKDHVALAGVYPAGRLDTDSEGLLLLTNDGRLQQRIADPRFGLKKTYLVQVEGEVQAAALAQLRAGVDLGDFRTQPCAAREVSAPPWLWPRQPPVRFRKTVPTSWLEITIAEGKNRQVRRMTARVGLPTLRLIRIAIGPWLLAGLLPGQWQEVAVPTAMDGGASTGRPQRPGGKTPAAGKAPRPAQSAPAKPTKPTKPAKSTKPSPAQK